MSKSIKNCFYKKLTFESLLKSHDRAKKNKTNRYELLKFSVDIETNIVGIMNSLKNGSYRLGKYKVFTIYEPKERIIKCLPYRDRIVQQWYIYEFIKPYIIPRIINTCCACIDNRGTHYAVLMVDKYINIMKRKYGKYYVLKLDIKKYFYNIDKNILYKIMNSFVSDKKLLWLTKVFIYDDEIDKLEELQDKLDDQNDDYERAQQAVADYLDEQMSAMEKQRDTVETYYDNVLDAIEKMNEKQQESLELAEAYEALMNAMTQKTKKVKYMLSIKIAQNGETPEKDNPVGKIYFKYIIMKGVELWLVVKDTLSKNLKINY